MFLVSVLQFFGANIRLLFCIFHAFINNDEKRQKKKLQSCCSWGSAFSSATLLLIIQRSAVYLYSLYYLALLPPVAPAVYPVLSQISPVGFYLSKHEIESVLFCINWKAFETRPLGYCDLFWILSASITTISKLKNYKLPSQLIVNYLDTKPNNKVKI